ncbi:lecithin retinol acyltransferase family protein [Luteibacter sp.]
MHLVSRRLTYTHHGIYVDKRRVVHYEGRCNGQ